MKKWKLKNVLKAIGPGIITGASDDDPSGIATYSQAGALFGMATLWTLPFSLPLMSAVQEISARLGRTTGHGIAGNLKKYYSGWLLLTVVCLLTIANVINIAADLGAMGASLNLIIGGEAAWYVAAFAGLSILLEIWIPYNRYVFFLKWLTFSIFSYVITAFVVKIEWGNVLKQVAFPRIVFTKEYMQMLIALFGTTISPYLFFWQSSQEVEEANRVHRPKLLVSNLKKAKKEIQRIEADTYFGMTFSNVIAFFIILTTAVTLFPAGIHSIESADQAAKALEPLAGKFASLIFALGIVGTGLLAIPVLAGSSAYAIGEAMHWRIGLDKKPEKAKGFYWVIALTVIVAFLLNFLHVNPMKALVWSAVLNGIVSVPLIVILILMSRDTKIMGSLTVHPLLQSLAWITAGLMGAMIVGLVAL